MRAIAVALAIVMAVALPEAAASIARPVAFNRPASLGFMQKVVFPSPSATLKIQGSPSPLADSQWFWRAGDQLEESFPRTAAVNSLTFALEARDDTTDYCEPDTPQKFEVFVGDRSVGTFTMVSGVKGKTGERIVKVVDSFRFPATSPRLGKITLRIEMKTTVCSGGGSFAWIPSGSVTLR